MKKYSIFLIVCWSLYDLANQFFALNIISLYFPRWLTIVKGAPEIFYSVAFGVSMVFVSIGAPVLGTVSDLRSNKRQLLAVTTYLSIVFTILLGFTSNVFVALLFFAVANFGCQIASVFYNALMVYIAPPEKTGIVSGTGRMFAYLGAMVTMYFTKPVMQHFGYEATFVMTGIYFLLFSLPILIFVNEPNAKNIPLKECFSVDMVREAFRSIKVSFQSSRSLRDFRTFLKFVFWGSCAMNTMILFMSILLAKLFMLDEGKTTDLLIFSSIFAVIGSMLSGWAGDKLGYKKSLIGVFAAWFGVFLVAMLAKPGQEKIIGVLAGIALGATFALTRAWVVHLVPEGKIGEVFGLFNLAGYLSSVVGPVAFGFILWWFRFLEVDKYRIALISLLVFVAIAFYYLLQIPETAAKENKK